MAAVVISGTHTLVGQTRDGQKVVFSTMNCDTGTTIGAVLIKPLVKINAWAMGVKHPGNTARTYIVSLGSDTSYLSGSNTFYVTPSGDPTSGQLCFMSIGE